MAQRIVQVDAFTSAPFSGNPAAVCVLERPAEESWMQQVALEMNLSETAFLHAEGDAYRLRWFTPTTEVELCGHATLASAHVLWEEGRLGPDQVARFETRSGRLEATKRGGWIEMDFPARPAESPLPAAEAAALLDALGTEAVAVVRNPLDVLVEVASEADARAIRPDLARLAGITRRGVIVTAPPDAGMAERGIDFVSRFFAPAYGVDEDPVTGSAHCTLGPYWARRLGRSRLRGFQVSERGGEVGVEVRGDRVTLRGQAVTVLVGELRA
jgi:PhzF family phenazine biosynthesis protein